MTQLLAEQTALASLLLQNLESRARSDYLTNFERKFRKEGRPIYRAAYVRFSNGVAQLRFTFGADVAMCLLLWGRASSFSSEVTMTPTRICRVRHPAGGCFTMYESHFGLRQRPFRMAPDSECYYPVPGTNSALHDC